MNLKIINYKIMDLINLQLLYRLVNMHVRHARA